MNKDSQFVRFEPWLKASATVEKGSHREYMEDRIMMSNFQYRDKSYYIFLLLDGHGGSEVVDYVKEHFTDILGKYVIHYRGHKIREVITKTFVEVDHRVREMRSGTTASLLLIIDSPLQIWLANVGDSTVYGISESEHKNKKKPPKVKVRKISTDHNVKYRSERKRVDEADAYTIEDGYVCTEDGHMLAVTRALGDADFGHLITPEPSIKRIKAPYSIFVLASDGIWDVMDGKALWAKLHPPKERRAWRDSAYRLNKWRNEAYDQHDNTSLILVYVDYQEHDHPRPKKKRIRKVGGVVPVAEPSSIAITSGDITEPIPPDVPMEQKMAVLNLEPTE
jgi:serine/threonine protein phosphatase PrpC